MCDKALGFILRFFDIVHGASLSNLGISGSIKVRILELPGSSIMFLISSFDF